MIYVGIDVAKDKHDCFICNSDGEVLFDVFTIKNNISGFDELMQKLKSVSGKADNIKVGLEATGHYSCNIISYLMKHRLTPVVINPLHTNAFRKAASLRVTKTDKVDAKIIASMLMSDVGLKPYSDILYHNEDLKSLVRYRIDRVSERSKLKTSLSRLVNILFPELEGLVSTIHSKSVYSLLNEFPGASYVATANLKHLTYLLDDSSKGHFKSEKASEIRECARQSIGSVSFAKSLELRHTINRIQQIGEEISEIEIEIRKIMDTIDSPTVSIPGIGYTLAATIIAEVGDFSRFENADKILAFAGCSPTTYQSGQLYSSHAKMEKHGSKYLRWALLQAARFVCNWDDNFKNYLEKKRSEGKHYNVAISHAAKKLTRLIYHLEITGERYIPS